MRVLALTFALLLLIAGPARAQGLLDRAADALELDPVYVDPDAERAISDGQADELRQSISDADAGPIYLAILPAEAAREAGGDAGAALREVAVSVDQPGTYGAVIGNHFRAGATAGILPEGRAGELAAESLDAKNGSGTAAVLEDFVRRVDDARGGEAGAGGGSNGGGGFPIFLVILAVAAVGSSA